MEETNAPRPRKEHRASWEENSDDFPDHFRFDQKTYWWEYKPSKIFDDHSDHLRFGSQTYGWEDEPSKIFDDHSDHLMFD